MNLLKVMVVTMISWFYFQSKDGYSYYLPIYSRVWFLFLVVFLIAFVGWFLRSNNFWLLIQFLDVLLFVLYLIKVCVTSNGLFNLFSIARVKKSITGNLLKERTKSKPKFVQMPAIAVAFSSDGKLGIKVKKLSDMRDSDLDELRQIITISLVGKWKNYAVINQRVTDDGLYFSFVAENVGISQAFTPKCEENLAQKPYFVTLQNNLKINLAKSPHIAIWGATGTGKTTLLFSIIAQCLSNKTILFFIDGKDEFTSFSNFYPKNRIVSDNQAVLRLLANICERVLPKRQQYVANKAKQRQELGLTGYDLRLRPIVIIADEVGSIVASMTSKEKKLLIAYLTQLTQKGRSVSIFLVVATQSPSVDVLPQAVRSQFATKILLGSTNGDIQRMALGQSVPIDYVDRFTGYYFSDGKTVVPQRFWVPNLIKNNLQTLKVLQHLCNDEKYVSYANDEGNSDNRVHL